jgi:hypothetical protein
MIVTFKGDFPSTTALCPVGRLTRFGGTPSSLLALINYIKTTITARVASNSRVAATEFKINNVYKSHKNN